MTVTPADIAAAQALNIQGWDHAARAFAAHRIAGEQAGLEKAAKVGFQRAALGGNPRDIIRAIRNLIPGDSQ